jgi:spore germination cell wall hydrolase CwlJ-like protein
MKKLITAVTAIATAASIYAQHTHKAYNLSTSEKVVAITILAEARGEGEAGMYAVAAVIAQRSFERKQTAAEVCLKKWQFSCWNGKSVKDLEHLLKVPQGQYAISLAKNVKQLSRQFVGYANHYHATWMKKKPYWAKGQKPVKVIGQHAFYKL